VFINSNNLTHLDDWLNNLQAIMLPFALIPLLKFVYTDKVMGKDFNINGWSFWVAVLFGVVLFVMNFVTVFQTMQGI
jgi:Mn2+/Fe2+ NRAMP family transporter